MLSLKKMRLLASLDAALLASGPVDSAASCSNHSVASQEALDMDVEFAAFQVPACIFSTKYILCMPHKNPL